MRRAAPARWGQPGWRLLARVAAAFTGSVLLALAGAGVAAATSVPSLPSLEALVRAAKAARAGNPALVQAQYELGRRGVEGLEGEPSPTSCHRRVAALRRVARGSVLSAEGFDRQNAVMRKRGDHEIAAGAEEHVRALPSCPGRFALTPAAVSGRFIAPLAGEAFFGQVRVRVPAGASAAELRWRGRLIARAVDPPRAGWTVVLPGSAPTGRGVLEASFLMSARRVVTATASVWLLRANAAVAPAAEREDSALSARLAAIARSFPGFAGIYVRDLGSGRTAAWNDDARFPAASTVKLGVLVAALDRFGPHPESTTFGYDLRALAAWSSNLAANRLFRQLGRGDLIEGQRLVEARLRRLGANGSTYPGEYRVGTAHAETPTAPPLVSQRTTTARDLGRTLATIHAAAVGSRVAQRGAGVTRHEAQVAIALLLDSEPSGDNSGLFRPWLGATVPIAQKQGWISSARHTAAIVYGPRGPVMVVLVTYRERLDLRQAQLLGRKVIGVALGGSR